MAKLSDDDAAAVTAAMRQVRIEGTSAARKLRGEIWEVRVDGDRVIYRVLFAEEGSSGRILLSLHAFKKKTQKTPSREIKKAEQRLRRWRQRPS